MTLSAIERGYKNLAFRDQLQHLTGQVISVTNFTEQDIVGSGGGGGGTISGGGGSFSSGSGSISSIKGSISISPIKISSTTIHFQKVFILGTDNKEYICDLDATTLSLREGSVISVLWSGNENASRAITRDDVKFAYNHNTDSNFKNSDFEESLAPKADLVGTPKSRLILFGILIAGAYFVFKISTFGWIGNGISLLLTFFTAHFTSYFFLQDATDHEYAAKCKSTFETYQDAVSKFDTSELDTASQT